MGLSFWMAYYLCIISMLSQTRVSQNGLSFRMAYYLCMLSQTKVSQSGSPLWTAYYLCMLSQTRVSQNGLSKSKLSVTRVRCLTVSCPMGGQVFMWSVSEWVLTVS